MAFEKHDLFFLAVAISRLVNFLFKVIDETDFESFKEEWFTFAPPHPDCNA